MSKYRLSKANVQCLLKDKPIVDGHGRKYYANITLKEALQRIDSNDAYDMFDIFMEDGGIDIVTKAGIKNE